MSLRGDPLVISFGGSIFSIAAAPNSLDFAVGSYSGPRLSLFGVDSAKPKAVFDDHSDTVRGLQYSRDG